MGFQGGYDAGRDPLRDDMRIYSFSEDIIRVGGGVGPRRLRQEEGQAAGARQTQAGH
jgi:hypothetical protein